MADLAKHTDVGGWVAPNRPSAKAVEAFGEKNKLEWLGDIQTMTKEQKMAIIGGHADVVWCHPNLSQTAIDAVIAKIGEELVSLDDVDYVSIEETQAFSDDDLIILTLLRCLDVSMVQF